MARILDRERNYEDLSTITAFVEDENKTLDDKITRLGFVYDGFTTKLEDVTKYLEDGKERVLYNEFDKSLVERLIGQVEKLAGENGIPITFCQKLVCRFKRGVGLDTRKGGRKSRKRYCH